MQPPRVDRGTWLRILLILSLTLVRCLIPLHCTPPETRATGKISSRLRRGVARPRISSRRHASRRASPDELIPFTRVEVMNARHALRTLAFLGLGALLGGGLVVTWGDREAAIAAFGSEPRAATGLAGSSR